MDDQVKLVILEQKVDDLKPIIHKLDATIEKLSEVNTTVSRMLLSMKKDYQSQKKLTPYYLLRLTNSVIKWTQIITVSCQEYRI